MARRHPLRQHCRICQKHRDEVGDLSARGKCQTCAVYRIEQNITDLVEHRGPFFDHWRARCIAAFGVALVDDSQPGR